MPRPAPLTTLLSALLVLVLVAGIALAALYVPYEVCYTELAPDGGPLTQCLDERGWAWDVPVSTALVYERQYAVQIAAAVSLALVPFLIVLFRRVLA